MPEKDNYKDNYIAKMMFDDNMMFEFQTWGWVSPQLRI